MSAVSPDADRRIHPREAVHEEVRLVDGGGHVFDVMMVDRSLRGLRIQFAGAATLPSDVTVLSRSAGVAHVAKVVWRTAPYAGLSITRTVDMRTATGPETATLRRLWREHIAS